MGISDAIFVNPLVEIYEVFSTTFTSVHFCGTLSILT